MTSTMDVELTERVRLAGVSRTIVRAVSSELTLARIVEVCQHAIMEGFRASGVWIQAFKGDELGHDAVRDDRGRTVELPHELKLIGRVVARQMWDLQGVTVFDGATTPDWVLPEEEQQRVYETMAELGITRLLSVPIGAGRECLGTLVLSRKESDHGWTPGEQRAALDIGRDLGRALATARAFEKERRVVAELREVNGYKARLISTLAHELKNPLTAILGHVEILDGDPELPHGVLHSIEVIERGGKRMQQLVEDLLVLSRADGEQRPLVPVAVDLAAVVDEALDLLGVEVLRKGLHVEREGPCGDVHAWGERQELDLVVTNLLSNAVKYTPGGGTVTVRLQRTGDAVVLEVADTGLGMSEADQEHLFEEFFRSTNPEALASPGSGLGLSIVHQAVERHGGTITFTSALGMGTTFVVTLPATPREDA
ncbi:GAF domain-containing sensor histidine kinase [Nocardioides solisilvae]|uniref:GAF domain-containing sensor histidine kinase n=1 Tax=Nocardioides solisilvae TaxID=1542435 RepID=UPI000D7493A2|nr:GAF domain-containing sensor histidine kinase [Nocardioides solisilvae]